MDVLYEIALVIHIVGVGLLIAADVLDAAVIARMRRARTVGELRTVMSVAVASPKLHGIAGGAILLAGIYMGLAGWGWTTGWIDVSFLAFIVAAAIGSGVIGRRLEKLAKDAFAAPDGELTGELRERALSPANVVQEIAMMFWIGGFIYVMVVKPAWYGSIVAMLVAIVLGWLVGQRAAAGAGAAPAAPAAASGAEPPAGGGD